MELGGTMVLMVILVAIGLYGLTLAPVTWVILSRFSLTGSGNSHGLGQYDPVDFKYPAGAFFPIIKSKIYIYGAFWLYAAICVLGFFYVR